MQGNGTTECTENCVSDTPSSSSNVDVGVAVGVSLACLVVIVAVVGAIVYWKRVKVMTFMRKRFPNPFKRATRSKDLNTNPSLPKEHYDQPEHKNNLPREQDSKPNDKSAVKVKENQKNVREAENVRPISDPYYESIDLAKFRQHVYANDVTDEVKDKNESNNISRESEITVIYEN